MKAVNILKGTPLAWTIIKYCKDLPKIDAPRTAGDFETERAVIADFTGRWVDDVTRAYDIHFVIDGCENVPEGPCVVIANHQSAFDVMAVIRALRGHQIGFIAKKDFAKVPILGRWIKAIRGIFITRGDARESLKTIQEGIGLLKDGFSLAIFPEGTRSKDGSVREFKAGSFKLATKSKVPILPVAIQGTSRIFEDSGVLTKGQTAYIRVLTPIETADMPRSEQATVHTRIQALIEQAVGELKLKEAQECGSTDRFVVNREIDTAKTCAENSDHDISFNNNDNSNGKSGHAI